MTTLSFFPPQKQPNPSSPGKAKVYALPKTHFLKLPEITLRFAMSQMRDFVVVRDRWSPGNGCTPLVVYSSVRTLLQMGAWSAHMWSKQKKRRADSVGTTALSPPRRGWGLSPLLAKCVNDDDTMPADVMMRIMSFVLIPDKKHWASLSSTMPHFAAHLQLCRREIV
jgi:hypothetical protein